MPLTEEQQKGAEIIRAFLQDPTHKYALVEGPAGSGKSFMLKECIKNDVRVKRGQACGVALAHSAKNVLSGFLNKDVDPASGESIDCYTLASILGMKPDYDKDGNEIYVMDKYGKKKIQDYRLIIVDEASMVNREQLNYLRTLKDPDAKIIFVGDRYQLPPIEKKGSRYEGEDSKVFQLSKYHARLTEPIRYDDAVGDAVQMYLKSIDALNDEKYVSASDVFNYHYNRQGEKCKIEYVTSTPENKAKVLGEALENFAKDPLSTRFLAYQRKPVAKMNWFFRDKLYPNCEEYQPGELIMAYAQFQKNQDDPPVTNGSILKLVRYQEDVYEFAYCANQHDMDLDVVKIPYIKAVLQESITGNIFYDIPIVSLTYRNQFNRLLETLADKAKKRQGVTWGEFWELKKAFLTCDFSYATTTHKAQGMTLKNVYVSATDIYGVGPISMKTKLQSMYVAVTRSEKNITVIY